MPHGSEASRAFGAAVRARRIELGYSYRIASRLAAMDTSSWQRIERGTNPTLHVMLRIAHVLEVPLADLVRDVDARGLPDDIPQPLTRAQMERLTTHEKSSR